MRDEDCSNNDKHANGVASPHDHAQRFNWNLDFEEAHRLVARKTKLPLKLHGGHAGRLTVRWSQKIGQGAKVYSTG